MHFAAADSYQITGIHEEEYIRGPGMLLKGDPESYITMIRYGVTKKK